MTDDLRGRFPADFAWGFAASAYQIEGAAHEDGRGPSIWDTFSRKPGAVVNAENGDVACDHYHHFRDDIAMMAELGARTYRFSVSWPRVLPAGTGSVNGRGMDFYERLVDELLKADIRPFLNLFHWDLPQALQDRGGFANPEVVGWYADYAALICDRLGDRVTDWMTFNEPAVFAFLAHADGVHAPGLHDWRTAIRVADNQLRAHGVSAAAIRSAIPEARVGMSIDVNQVVPSSDSAMDVHAAQQYSAARDGWFLDPLFGRGYPKPGVEAHEAAGHLEGVELADLPDISVDYLGLNYYRRETITAHSDLPFDWTIEPPRGAELTDMGWHVAPDGLRDRLVQLNREYEPKEVIVTENGAAYLDAVEADGSIRDRARQTYLERHLMAVAEAIGAGVPVSGYHVWSLMDNFEWSYGYSKRFGVVHVDFETLKRTVKESGHWYQELITSSR